MKFTSILSLAAALGAVSAAVSDHHTHVDPCATFGAQVSNPNATITLQAVNDCYKAQKFDHNVAKKTIQSLENLYGNFYAFKDSARVKTGVPFETPRVDVLRGLKEIGAKKWKSDYEFQTAILLFLTTLNDAHVSYQVNCYNSVGFVQPLFLYSPVVDGKQSIRVLRTVPGPGVPTESIDDCEVTEIDGVPALKAIQEWADLTSGISKDPGVRLNENLARLSWFPAGWKTYYGGFTYRFIPPKKDSMVYTLKCGKKTQKITVPWAITPSSATLSTPFNSTETFWKTQCLAPPVSASSSTGDKALGPKHLLGKSDHKLVVAPEVVSHQQKKTAAASPITHAKLVFSSTTTGFYTLNNSNKCVVVLTTEEFDYDTDQAEYSNFIKGVETLRDAGCKKLIFDVSNNGGGLIDFAYFINALFFPKSKYFFTQDINDNAYVRGASKLAIKEANAGYNIFDARGFANITTEEYFTDNAMYLDTKKYTRAGVTDPYTQRNYFGGGWDLLPLKKPLSWTAKDMAIVSNGFCGSACTLAVAHFNIAHGVKTYAVGGIKNRPLSYMSFPGGVVWENQFFNQQIEALNYTAHNGPSYLPLNTYAGIPWSEAYATESSTIPLEYDYKRFAAGVHYNQDPVAARHPDQIWLKIAADFK